MERTELVIRRLSQTGNKARVMACGDWHLGSNTFDEAALDENIKLCLTEHIYMVCMGDQMEAATKVSPGSGAFDQENPDSQVSRIIDKLRPLVEAELLIGIHSGNHEMRVTNLTGVNITKLICEILHTPYLNHVAYHEWRVGKQSYSVCSTHGASGARLPWTKVKSAIDMFRFASTDLILYGHTHGLDHMTQLYKEVDGRKGKVESLIRHAVLTGSYLRYSGSYAEAMNLPPVPIGSPIITLFGDKHEIRVSL